MKTRTYLTLMAAAILLPVISFSAIGLDLLLQWERDSRIRAVQETARVIALTIDREVAAAEAALRTLSHSRSIDEGNFKRLHDLMSMSNRTPDSWTLLSDYDGKPLVNTLVPFGAALPSPNTGAWTARAYDSRKTTVSNYFVSTLGRRPAVAVNVPVPSATGRKYVLSQMFQAEHFNKALRPGDISSSWIVGIFDAEGITIARNVKPEEFVGKRVRDAIYTAVQKSAEGVILHPSGENISVYDVFTHTELTGWTVSIGVPQDEIEVAARRAALYGALALVAIFAVAALIVTFLARRLAGSLELAANAAKALGGAGIPKLQSSKVSEVDVLQTALYEAGIALSAESESRRKLEEERERLLINEREARRQAEAQNKAKDDFLAMLGHELRNPLGAISGAISIMEASNATADQVARARGIGRNQVDHLARIVDDLLDVGRIMAGKILLRKQPVELGGFVRRCVDSQRAVDLSNHTWNVQTESVWVQADTTRLEQIVGNVLVNAVKYTPRDGLIQVRVRAEESTAVIVVQDTGIGISAELLPVVFDVFVQGPTTIDRAQGGLGLGLALVRQLLALHGGTVSAASAGSDRGSTFTLRLPQYKPTSEDAAPDIAPRTPGKRKYILVVEDNRDAREMLTTTLALHGFTVAAAANGEEALVIAAETHPDVAIVDVGLPGISGYQVAQRLRAGAETASIKLIALTGYGLEQDRQLAMQAGFATHITKPYTIEGLLDVIASDA